MKKLLIVSLACCFVACRNQPGAVKEESERNSKKQDMFPVTSFLAGQVHEVDSLKLALIKYTTSNDRTDTVPISIEEFKMLANEFMKPDITEATNTKYYKENSFADQSIPSVTITYSTTVGNLEIQRLDIVIKPDPLVNDKVQSIYMEKLSHNGDTSILKKLFWKTDRYFQIVTSTQVGNNPPTFNQLKVSWSYED